MAKTVDATKIDYAGIAYTPFIFLAAQVFKQKKIQLNDIGLWHNYRSGAHNTVLMVACLTDMSPLFFSNYHYLPSSIFL